MVFIDKQVYSWKRLKPVSAPFLRPRWNKKRSATSMAQKGATLLKYEQDDFMEILENSFETPEGCLSCSIRLGNYFSPTGEQFFVKEKTSVSFSENFT